MFRKKVSLFLLRRCWSDCHRGLDPQLQGEEGDITSCFKGHHLPDGVPLCGLWTGSAFRHRLRLKITTPKWRVSDPRDRSLLINFSSRFQKRWDANKNTTRSFEEWTASWVPISLPSGTIEPWNSPLLWHSTTCHHMVHFPITPLSSCDLVVENMVNRIDNHYKPFRVNQDFQSCFWAFHSYCYLLLAQCLVFISLNMEIPREDSRKAEANHACELPIRA